MAKRRLRLGCGALLLLAGASVGAAGTAPAAPPLRACADPDALPFSSERDSTPGLYIELGRSIAHALGRDFSATWYVSNFGKRAVRSTLLASQCDFFVGLPGDADFMGRALVFSRPFTEVGYALVTPPDRTVTGLADLGGKRVAVLFGSPPQSLLAEHAEITPVTVMSAEEGMQALATGRADIAFIWGPNAGYLNRTRYDDRYAVLPVGNAGMHWPVTIGFARADAALRDQVDAVLPQLHDDISRLAAKYGFPAGRPIMLAAAAPTLQPAAAESPAPADDAALVAKGREIFNGTCAHCHGIDAVQSERKRDLRLLTHRYGDQAQDVYFQTVTHGRPSKGMPNWREVYSDEELGKIFAYLKTVQTPEETSQVQQ
jgi:ABC-type amino acid transport substrate-binding protein/cytochrome c553